MASSGLIRSRWRLLNTVDIRITDDEGDALYVRFEEPSNTFSLLNLANGTFSSHVRPAAEHILKRQRR
jgi:hypothetical protein